MPPAAFLRGLAALAVIIVLLRPTWVGVDPYNKRIDRNSDDNLTPVDMPR